eukprot:scaffold43164_cov25-Cyclotella_meneghiniana.AAC.2
MSNAKDVPPITLTTRHWNDVLNNNPERSWRIWKQICTFHEPDLAWLVEDPRSNDAWKSLLWHIVAHIRIMETEFNELVDYHTTMRNILNKMLTNLTKVMKSILTRKTMIWISHLVIL